MLPSGRGESLPDNHCWDWDPLRQQQPAQLDDLAVALVSLDAELGFRVPERGEPMRMLLSVGIVQAGRARSRWHGLDLPALWPSPPPVPRPPLRADSFPNPGFARLRMNLFVLPSTARLRGAVGDRSPSGRSSRVALPIDLALRADAHASAISAHPRRRSHSGLWSPTTEGSQVGGLRSSAS